MKRLLFTAKNLNIGGMEKSLVNLLNALAKDYEITLILEEKTGPLLKRLDSRIKVQEYKVAQDSFVFLRKIKNFTKRFIWQFKNKNKYDFSCSYATYSVIGSHLALIASRNNALYVHSNYYEALKQNKKEINKFFHNLNYEKFKHLIFVSNESLNSLKNILPWQDALVINNLTDYKTILKEAHKESNLFPKDKNNILYVGRLDNTSKNLDLLIKAFSFVNLDKNHLYLLGDGYYKKEILKKIKELKLENNITLLKENNNPYPYMRECDLLILTSRYEGFPVVYNEALVLNKEFLTTVSVSDEFIDIKNYFYIIDSKEKLISDFINNYQRRKRDYKIDFLKINKLNLQRFINLIEEEKNE